MWKINGESEPADRPVRALPDLPVLPADRGQGSSSSPILQ